MNFNNLKVTVNQNDDQSIDSMAIDSYICDQVRIFMKTFNRMPSSVVFREPTYGSFNITVDWIDPVANSIAVSIEPV